MLYEAVVCAARNEEGWRLQYVCEDGDLPAVQST